MVLFQIGLVLRKQVVDSADLGLYIQRVEFIDDGIDHGQSFNHGQAVIDQRIESCILRGSELVEQGTNL